MIYKYLFKDIIESEIIIPCIEDSLILKYLTYSSFKDSHH